LRDPPHPMLPLADLAAAAGGSSDLFGRWFAAADAALRLRGVHLRIRHDFDAFRDRNTVARGGVYRFALYDPDCSVLGYDNAFWFDGVDEAGNLVATQAGRFFDWRATNLAAELSSLRMLYRDPSTQALPGEACRAAKGPGERVRGRILHAGGGWYHPNYRSLGLSSIMPCTGRLYALTRWNTDFTVSFMREILVQKGVPQHYGYRRIEPGITLRGTVAGDVDCYLVTLTKAELLDDLVERLAWLEESVAAGSCRGSFPNTARLPSVEHHGTRQDADRGDPPVAV
jgi:hypothetical protein